MNRVFNILISLILLIFLSPLLLIIILGIKIDSRGPVFFTQMRIGKNNKVFVLYKFRTMRTEAPNVATHLLVDPQSYITPFGKFLRKSSIDELPQFINILKGDMTFIGPRPALYNQFDLIDLRTRCGVHTLRPGVTGWAQVNGRDYLDINEKVDYDFYYLEHRKLIFDLKILYMTVFKVLRAEGVLEGSQNPNTPDKRERFM
ncbi:MAG: sugar transferase [Desulfosporosinus sp.]|nr:sugar transferase [Desulfosporosinus sp.]